MGCWYKAVLGRKKLYCAEILFKKKKSQKKTSAGLTVSNPTLGGSSRLLTPCVHLLNLLLGHFPEGRKRLNSV